MAFCPPARRPLPRTKKDRLTKPSPTSIIQQSHLLLQSSIGGSSRAPLFLIIRIAFVRILVTGPVHADEIKPGPDLLQNPVQRLFMLGVVGRRLLASELVSEIVQTDGLDAREGKGIACSMPASVCPRRSHQSQVATSEHCPVDKQGRRPQLT